MINGIRDWDNQSGILRPIPTVGFRALEYLQRL